VSEPTPSPLREVLIHARDTLRYLAHPDTLLALGVLALATSLLEWVGSLPWGITSLGFPLARLFVNTYFFLVVRKAAIGSRRLPVPSDHIDTWDTLFHPLLKVLLALALALAVVLAYAQLRGGIVDFFVRYQARPLMFLSDQGRLGLVLVGLGLIQLPLATLAALCAPRALDALDPRTGPRLAWRTGARYPLLFLLLSVLGLIGHAMDHLAMDLHAELPLPLATPVLGHLIRLWAPLAQARLLGEFIHRNRARLTLARS
jgi:hypothetical protein